MGKQRRVILDYEGDIFKQINLLGRINSCYIIHIDFELEISQYCSTKVLGFQVWATMVG